MLTSLHLYLGSLSPKGAPHFSSAAIFSFAGILVLLKFSSILVPLTFLHLHLGSPMSEVHPKDFSSAGTFLHLIAISYAFSSTGTLNFSSAGTINFSSAGTFCT